MKRTMCAALLFLSAVADTVVSKETQAPRRGRFHGAVEVSEDGRIHVQQLLGVTGTLAEAVKSQLQARRALPATRGGRAVAALAPLSGEVRLTPAGDAYRVSLDGVALVPAPLIRYGITYPINSLRLRRVGSVELEFALDSTGAPVAVTVVSSTHPDLLKAVREPVLRTRYRTAGWDPQRRYRLGATFRIEEVSAAPAFECTADPAYPRLDAGPSCIDTVDVFGSYVRVGTQISTE